MVILNADILICKASMINSIKNIMQQVMEEYFDREMLVEKIENKKKIMSDIMKEKVNETKSEYFWYINSSDSACTYVHKRGKKEGYMCQRKIRTNLNGEKPDYLCSTHSKKHIRKKRIIKESDYKRKKTIKKRKIKQKKTYICNGGVLDLARIIGDMLN